MKSLVARRPRIPGFRPPRISIVSRRPTRYGSAVSCQEIRCTPLPFTSASGNPNQHFTRHQPHDSRKIHRHLAEQPPDRAGRRPGPFRRPLRSPRGRKAARSGELLLRTRGEEGRRRRRLGRCLEAGLFRLGEQEARPGSRRRPQAAHRLLPSISTTRRCWSSATASASSSIPPLPAIPISHG